jgi:hypothetical protein
MKDPSEKLEELRRGSLVELDHLQSQSTDHIIPARPLPDSPLPDSPLPKRHVRSPLAESVLSSDDVRGTDAANDGSMTTIGSNVTAFLAEASGLETENELVSGVSFPTQVFSESKKERELRSSAAMDREESPISPSGR